MTLFQLNASLCFSSYVSTVEWATKTNIKKIKSLTQKNQAQFCLGRVYL